MIYQGHTLSKCGVLGLLFDGVYQSLCKAMLSDRFLVLVDWVELV